MAAALRRMSVVAVTDTAFARVLRRSVKFSVQTPDLGRAQDDFRDLRGEPLEIGFKRCTAEILSTCRPTRCASRQGSRAAATIEPVGWNDPASYMGARDPLRLVD